MARLAKRLEPLGKGRLSQLHVRRNGHRQRSETSRAIEEFGRVHLATGNQRGRTNVSTKST
jgi:hypothetical protein